ncbi:MAG: Gfo/Idh/MocA family protein [Candidatus Limnocylindria bacterium]
MSERPLRVAVVGYGLAGSVFHAPLIAATAGMEVAGVVTGDPARQAQAAADVPAAAVLSDARPLWEDASSYDLVVVATPNRAHVPLGLAALEAGLPVVIDKPLAASTDDGRRLDAAARERGLMLAVFHNRRWDGDMLTVKRLIGEGALGEVLRFESRFERWRPERAADAWRERGDPAEAGGILFDLGSHLVDQALVLFGPVDDIYAEVDRRRPGALVGDDVFIALRHAGGVRSHLWMSHLAGQAGPRMRVLGTEAAYVKWGLDPQEDALRAGARPRDAGWGREPRERWGLVGAGEDARPVETEPGSYQRFYEGVATALREGKPPPVTAADAVAGLEILEAALHESGIESRYARRSLRA